MTPQSPASAHAGPTVGIQDLPNEVLTRVLILLDGASLASLSCVSAHLRCLSTDPTIWRDLCASTWPSLIHPRVLSLPITNRSFFTEAFPFPSSEPVPSIPTDRLPHELISAVDIYHEGRPIFSRLIETDTSSPWFRSAPFRLDALDRKAAAPTQQQPEMVISPAGLTLSWILIDPNRGRAVNLSSRLPLTIERHWYTGETLVRFAIVVGEVMISTVVTCSEETGHVREVTLTIEDEEGISVSGEGSLVILAGAMEGRRKMNGEEEMEAKRRYEEFVKGKRKRKESKARREFLVDFCCSAVGSTVFLALVAKLIFRV